MQEFLNPSPVGEWLKINKDFEKEKKYRTPLKKWLKFLNNFYKFSCLKNAFQTYCVYSPGAYLFLIYYLL